MHIETTPATETMQAVIQERYGPSEFLSLADVPRPIPGDGEVLVKVRASSVNAMEWHLMTGLPYFMRLQTGLRRPRDPRLGADLSGEVVSMGGKVTRFRPGDAVFGDIFKGAYAEYVVVPERLLVAKPESVSFEQAAALPVAGLTALQGLRDAGGLQSGQEVLVVGASGGVGTFAVQIARTMGARVTAVCSTANVATAQRLGANRVIDYTRQDFLAGDERYHLIIDGPGSRSPRELHEALLPGGTYVLYGGPKGRLMGPLPRMLGTWLRFRIGDRDYRWILARSNQDDLAQLADWVATGQIDPVIERVVPLADVAEALRRQGEFHARGKTVVSLG